MLARYVRNTKFFCNCRETRIGRPQPESLHNGGSQEMNIDPADAASMQIPLPNERDHVAMGHKARLMHLFISSQQFPATTSISNQEFSIDQLVSSDLIETQEFVQCGRVGLPTDQGVNPYRSVHQNHQAALRRRDGLSRRRGTSRA
jgi:hypothetical protein